MVWLASPPARGRRRAPLRPAGPGVKRRAGQNGGLIRCRSRCCRRRNCRGRSRRGRLRAQRCAQPLGEILAIIAPHHFVADAVSEFADPRFQRRAALRRGKGAAFDLARPDDIGEPRAAEITSSIAARPPERARSSGSCPSGSSAKRRLLPGLRCGSARSAARHAAFWPALSPSKQRIGSSAIFHSSVSWFSVSAVPSGATLASKPE